MPLPIVITGAAIGLGVAFYLEHRNKTGDAPASGAEGLAGGERASAATGTVMATNDAGQPVQLEQTDAGAMPVTSEERAIDPPASIPPTVGGVINSTTVQPSGWNASQSVTRLNDSLAKAIAENNRKMSDPTYAKKALEAKTGTKVGGRVYIPITRMPTKGMSRLQASRALDYWAGTTRGVVK